MKNKSAYYAHSKLIYGTKREKQELNFLRTVYTRVICPHNDIGELGDIEHYCTIANHQHEIVATEVRGMIGKGVFKELRTMAEHRKPAYVLRNKKLIKIKSVEVVDDQNWRFFARLIT